MTSYVSMKHHYSINIPQHNQDVEIHSTNLMDSLISESNALSYFLVDYNR